MTRGFQPLNLGSNPGACTNLYGKEFIIAYRIWNIMRCLSLLLTGMLIFSGCLDFLDGENENRTPLPIAGYEGNGPFEPNIEITFTGKGSSDPDGDILEYYWDFDNNDEKDERKIGDLANIPKALMKYRFLNSSVSSMAGENQVSIARRVIDSASQRRGVKTTFEATKHWRPNETIKSQFTFMMKYGWWAFNYKNKSAAIFYAKKAIGLCPLNKESWRLFYCAIFKLRKER